MNNNENKIRQNPVIQNIDCYVAFLDILGFKEIINTWEPSKIEKVFEEVLDKINIIQYLRAESLGDNTKKIVDYYNYLHENLFAYVMSDSIIFAIEENDEGLKRRNPHFLLYVCDQIQKYFFEKHEILLRGGVAKGYFYGKGQIVFGKGLVEAYNLEEKAKYPRIIVHDDLKQTLEDEYNDWTYKLYEENDFCFVNWFYHLGKKRDELKSFCEENISKYNDNTDVKAKYQWILDIISHK